MIGPAYDWYFNCSSMSFSQISPRTMATASVSASPPDCRRGNPLTPCRELLFMQISYH